MEDQQALIVSQPRVVDITDYAMTADSVVRQVNMIQDVMRRVMHDGEHWGTIPGTNKPTLLKPGAEKLSMTFRFAPTYEIKMTNLPNGHREYEVVTTLTHIPTGAIVGQGVGSCSTMESRYRFRKADQKCPECGKETIIKGKKEYGGGWLCYQKKGGCGTKFKDGDTNIENQNMGRVEYDSPADYWNTVLKMAKKRSHVDAVLTATAASDIFTQDVEDMVDNGTVAVATTREGVPMGPPPPKTSLLDEAKKAFAVIKTLPNLKNHWEKHSYAYRADWQFEAIEEAKDKRKAELAKALKDKEPVLPGSEAPPEPASTINCPRTETTIPVETCNDCSEQDGCPERSLP